MVNISQAIKTLATLKGSKMSTTIGTKVIKKAVREADPTGRLSEILSKYPNAKIDVACKASENGFNIAGFKLRDGSRALGSGAISVTGMGTNNVGAKMRFNLGQDGNILSYRAHQNLGQTPRIQDVEMASSIKKGVLEASGSAGKYSGYTARLDVPKAVEAVGMKVEGQELVNGCNYILAEGNNIYKRLFAGKEVKVDKEWAKNVLEDSGLKELFERIG